MLQKEKPGWGGRVYGPERWSCRHGLGDSVPSPVLGARMSQLEAKEATLGAHAVGYDSVCAGDGVLLLITGGIIYDVIVEPPSVGSMTDEHGHQRLLAFLAYRVNGQYIMEGLSSSFLFTVGEPMASGA